MAPVVADFEEAFRVIRTGEGAYVGAHCLRKPVKQARGVYGGHMIAQTLLVAIENQDYIEKGWLPVLFHLHFIRAGDSRVPMEYLVESHEGLGEVKSSITVTQSGKVRATASCSLSKDTVDSKPPSLGIHSATADQDYSFPSNLQQVHHTDFIRNAYSEEFLHPELVPEEEDIGPAERWVTVWSGLNNIAENPNAPLETIPTQPYLDKTYLESKSMFGRTTEMVPLEQQKLLSRVTMNYVGLADLTDSALLTALARVLRIPWNPTENHPFLPFDDQKDARYLLGTSMNILHLFHYNAMSLDHHIYFHGAMRTLDVVKEWVSLRYQYKRFSNSRLLVRGEMFNTKGEVIATVIQEGLTYLTNGVPDIVKL